VGTKKSGEVFLSCNFEYAFPLEKVGTKETILDFVEIFINNL